MNTNNADRARVRIGRIDFDAPFKTVILPKSEVERILSKAEKIKAPFLPPATGGFDGAERRIWILNAMSVLHVSWWLDCPPEWKQLQSLWDSIVAVKNTYATHASV